ncbi:rRNA maturation RNase YbeY [Parasulfuritortus cantonensis]|uniref:Endoribonuclease YbeY n=1 Tax=Parasulfuritortus cantonensis TaxID=2528202 RepID=A0A4R1B8C6_9PROT|nr:rRNA maturation RNase YbeY [Parasulfuritortus cantonensis]TCJ12875.1 rRNA maturation RNase YbeY [Parasulfuritortus cantonensis]
MANAPKLDLTVQYAMAKDGLPGRAQFRAWARAALQHDVVATLRIVDADEGRALNRDYRGKDYATNVLTFEYGPDASLAGAPLAGDVVVCAPVVVREAAEQGKDPLAHYAHLTVHGMLHLQGYDHETDAEAAVMEALESFVMMRMGFPDPYQYHE